MHEYLATFASSFQLRAWQIFYASTICFALEMVLARERYTLASRFRAMVFWVVYLAITVLAFTFFNRFWGSLGIRSLLHIDLRWLTGSPWPALNAVGGFATVMVGLLIGEFFYYWFHRLQHAAPFFWRFHEVHHSLREMSAWNSNHHFTEEIFRIPFVVIPISLLFHFDAGPVPALIGILLGMQGIYEHSNTKLHLGPLRYLIADNRYHRLHHSLEPHHFSRNFGSGTPVWDMVFRTATFPKKGEWPAVGLAGVSEPRTLREFLFMPFSQRAGDFERPLAR